MHIQPGLHRANKQADWALVPARDQNGWQRVAAATSGIVTIGNVLTLTGFILVLAGLGLTIVGQYTLAFYFVLVGRAFDLIDGWFADITATKSPVGEFADHTADKLATGIALCVLVAVGLLPWLAVLMLAAPQLIITLLAFRSWRSGSRMHPSATGKQSMAWAWVGVVCFMFVPVMLHSNSTQIMEFLGYAACATSLVLGIIAIRNYRS